MRFRRHTMQGFSMIDLMVTLALIGILLSAAVPSLKGWSRGYQIKAAAMDLYVSMQRAKLGAVKDNKTWTVDFNPDSLTGYQIRDGLGHVVREVDFQTAYGHSIQFKNPTSSTKFDQAILKFNPSGVVTQTGFAFISDTESSKYYRVGVPFVTGIVKVERWNGSQWE